MPPWSGRVLAGAAQGANFPSVKSCNYADAAGSPRGANSLPAPNDSPNLLWAPQLVQRLMKPHDSPRLARPRLSIRRSGGGIVVSLFGEEVPVIAIVRREGTMVWNICREQEAGRWGGKRSTWPPRWPRPPALHVNNSLSLRKGPEHRVRARRTLTDSHRHGELISRKVHNNRNDVKTMWPKTRLDSELRGVGRAGRLFCVSDSFSRQVHFHPRVFSLHIRQKGLNISNKFHIIGCGAKKSTVKILCYKSKQRREDQSIRNTSTPIETSPPGNWPGEEINMKRDSLISRREKADLRGDVLN